MEISFETAKYRRRKPITIKGKITNTSFKMYVLGIPPLRIFSHFTLRSVFLSLRIFLLFIQISMKIVPVIYKRLVRSLPTRVHTAYNLCYYIILFGKVQSTIDKKKVFFCMNDMMCSVYTFSAPVITRFFYLAVLAEIGYLH